MISALLLIALLPAATIQGTVRAEGTREPIRHAVVHLEELNRSVRVDEGGAFTLFGVPPGRWRLRAAALGFQPYAVTVYAPPEGVVRLDLELPPAPLPLTSLQVRGGRDARAGPAAERALWDREVQPGVVGLSRAEVRALPATGEADVLRAVQALPGVTALNDLNAQLHVRGGGPDQNLFLVDGARVLAPYHLFGVAGAFNTDAVARMDVYRGALPARFGGALSSVIDLEQRGDGERRGLDVAIGSVAGRAAAHGPIGQDGGWMLAGRSSRAAVGGFRYLDADHPYSFHDANLRVSVDAGRGHRLRLSGFGSADDFGLRAPSGTEDLRSRWRNAALSLRWEVRWRAWAASASAWGSGYLADMSVGVLGGGGRAPVDNRVTLGGGRVEAAALGVRAGAEVERGQLSLTGTDVQGGYLTGEIFRDYTVPAGYVEAERRMGPLRLSPGVRVAWHRGVALPEPRLSARLELGANAAFTVGAGRTRQVLSTLRDDRQALPGTVFWFSHPAWTPYSVSDGASAALEGWVGGEWSMSAGAYARRFTDVARWMPVGTRDVGQVTWDDGRAAGIELSVRRHAGPVTGWVGYGWGRVQMRDSATGRDVDAVWDRRHAVDAALFHSPRPWLQLSAQATLGTGLPFWPWVGNVNAPRLDPLLGQVTPGAPVPVYGDRQMRYPAYFRVDVGARATAHVWGAELQPVIGLRNVTRRANVLYYRGEARTGDDGVQRAVLVPVRPFPSTTVVTLGLEARL